jgi:hypothetical protein
MRLGSEAVWVDLSVAEVQPPVPGASPGGDVLVVARMRLHDYTAMSEAWIDRDVWKRFLTELATLDRRRTGEAVLDSISPGELRLRIHALDRAGHMGVDGQMSHRYAIPGVRPSHAASAAVATIGFDPTLLPLLVETLSSGAEH